MIEKPIQAKTFEVFVITRPLLDSKCFSGLELCLYSPLKKEPKLISIENLIIDLLVSEHKKRGDYKHQNLILRDPLKPMQLFMKVNNRLQYNSHVELATLRNHLNHPDGPPIVELFEQTMVAVWSNKDAYLDQFTQYIYRPNRNLIEALSVFIMFLSKHIRAKYVSFVTEFLLVLLHLAFRIYHTHFNVQRFMLQQSSEYQDLVVQTERRMLVIFGNNKQFWLDPSLVFRVFREYLVSNGFLMTVSP